MAIAKRTEYQRRNWIKIITDNMPAGTIRDKLVAEIERSIQFGGTDLDLKLAVMAWAHKDAGRREDDALTAEAIRLGLGSHIRNPKPGIVSLDGVDYIIADVKQLRGVEKLDSEVLSALCVFQSTKHSGIDLPVYKLSEI